MTPQFERARRLQDTMNTPGWADAIAILNAQAQEARDELYDLMASTPDKLTGKTALRLASRAKALTDYKESIEDELKILVPPNPRQGRGS